MFVFLGYNNIKSAPALLRFSALAIYIFIMVFICGILTRDSYKKLINRRDLRR
jgi:hypothetical protein